MRRFLLTLFTCSLLCSVSTVTHAAEPLRMIVMDPLAAPLSCPCVEGYAQRKYEKLAEHLEAKLGRPVQLAFAQALSVGLKETDGKVDLIIGKDSVIRADAKVAKIGIHPIAQLSDKQGSTQQYGLIVVNKADPAKETVDLDGYTIIFGPSEAAEKHSAALDLLKAANVTIPQTLHIDEACSDGACKVIDLGPQSKTAAVISSYAQPLLEGCGTIKKGDLRVVGRTEPVKFVSAFVNNDLTEVQRSEIKDALTAANANPEMLTALESLFGFLPYESKSAKTVTAKKK